MYCPLCGAEYRHGFTVCSDCQVSLVPDPPTESADDSFVGGTSFAPVWSGSDPESDILEIPAEDSPINDDYENEEGRGDPSNFDPEDATAELWSGGDVHLAAMITSSLRENHIPYRSDTDTSNEQSTSNKPNKLFVLPVDEDRAKEIVREIVDAAPPE